MGDTNGIRFGQAELELLVNHLNYRSDRRD